MKKVILILAFLIAVPMSMATCSIENEAAVCTLPQFREKLSPIYNPKSNISELSETPEARLNPADRDDVESLVREFAPAGSDNSYNSSCQFGVCLQNRSTPLFQQPKQ